jgi:hypothetical protein
LALNLAWLEAEHGDTASAFDHLRRSCSCRRSDGSHRIRWMLGHEDPSLTLRTYADLFDSDLDALADVLDGHRAAALQPSIANSDSETDGENVLGTLQQSA